MISTYEIAKERIAQYRQEAARDRLAAEAAGGRRKGRRLHVPRVHR